MDKYEILKKHFGYETFRGPQAKIIDWIVENDSAIVVLPTGFGKSLIFQIPALLFEGTTIVISPLVALMKDQIKHLKERKIPSCYFSFEQSQEEQEKLIYDVLNNKYKIIYTSPERLQNGNFVKIMKKLTISFLVVDEAHTILWAEGFRVAFSFISKFVLELNRKPKIMALTATATPLTIKKIKKYLSLENPKQFVFPVNRNNIFYQVVCTDNKLDFIKKYLNRHSDIRGLIYCMTRTNVVKLSQKLTSLNIMHSLFHGGMTKEEKDFNMQNFYSKKSLVMICTNAFGMGIDLPDIRFVIQYDPPLSLEDLQQEWGRAGRDGNRSVGLILFSFSDLKKTNSFIKQQYFHQTEMTKQFNKVVDFCLTKKCLHQYLSNYFQQKIEPCGNLCSNCRKQK